jgi:hypothetical protein
MYGMLTRIVVKPGKRIKLLEYLRWDAEVAKASEPGTWRFDVWENRAKLTGGRVLPVSQRGHDSCRVAGHGSLAEAGANPPP